MQYDDPSRIMEYVLTFHTDMPNGVDKLPRYNNLFWKPLQTSTSSLTIIKEKNIIMTKI